MAEMSVRVVAPDHTVFEGPASALVIPAWDGRMGILRGHAPMITLLAEGDLVVEGPEGVRETVHVAGGVLKVEDNQVTVLTEHAGQE